MEFSKCICLCNCLCHCLFFGQVMSPHHSDQMSQRSKVSRMALWKSFLFVFVFVIVFVFVFVFVIVFFLVRSCPLITLGSLFVFFAPVIKMLQKLAGDEWNTVMVCVIFIQLDTIWWGWDLKHFKIFFCWAYKWLLAGDIYLKIPSFPRLPWGFTYLGWIT